MQNDNASEIPVGQNHDADSIASQVIADASLDSDEDSWKPADEEDEYKMEKHDYRTPKLRLMEHPHTAYDDLGDLSALTERFNFWAEILGSRSASSRPWVRGARALQSRERIDALLEQLHSEIRSLKTEVSSFNQGTAFWSDSEWYRDFEDLTDVDPQQLGLAFRGDGDSIEPKHISNLHSYVEYLEEMLPRAAARTDATENGERYLSIIRELILKVGADGCTHAKYIQDLQVRCQVLLKAVVLRLDSPRVFPMPLDSLTQKQMSASDAYFDIVRRKDNELEFENITYWNFAKSFRILWAAYNEQHLFPYGRSWRQQFRILSIDVLRDLHSQSEREIRKCTDIALGNVRSSLPVELQEMIFETEMRIEGVPLQLSPEALDTTG